MPKNRAMALKPPAITRVQGKSSFCMGAPPVPGKAVTTGNFVAVGGTGVAVGAVAVGVPAAAVAVGVPAAAVAVSAAAAVCVAAEAVGVAADCTRQVSPVMVLEFNVTAPVCARALPFKVAPFCRAMDVSARIFPMNLVPVARRVTDDPSLHHTLHGSPPVTDELADVVSVVAALKIQTPVPVSSRLLVSMKASAQ